jgi:hypothetical protein
MVGDSKEDQIAADDNNITFVLRRTPLNAEYFLRFNGISFTNL